MSELWFESEDRMMAEYNLVNYVFRILKNRVNNGGSNKFLLSGEYVARLFLDKSHGDYIDTFTTLRKFSETFKMNGNFYIEGIDQKIISVSLTDSMLETISSQKNFASRSTFIKTKEGEK